MHQVRVEKTSTIPLPDLIDSVVNGDEVIFTQDDLPVAKLVALKNGKKNSTIWQRKRPIRNVTGFQRTDRGF